MYKNENCILSKEDEKWETSGPVCNHDSNLKEKPFNVEDMVGMHRKFNDINCSLASLTSNLQGILFICASRENVEKIKLSTPPATPVEICEGSIAENLLHLEAMIEDARLLADHIAGELGVDI